MRIVAKDCQTSRLGKPNKMPVSLIVASLAICILVFLSQGANANEFNRKKAINEFGNDEFKLSFELFESLKVRDDPEVDYYVGAMLARNLVWSQDPSFLAKKFNGVPLDVAKGLSLIQKSALAGFASAQSLLGRFHLLGSGVNRDPKEALRLFEAAAESGDLAAFNALGNIYSNGKITEKNMTISYKWFYLYYNCSNKKLKKNWKTMERVFFIFDEFSEESKKIKKEGSMLAQEWIRQSKIDCANREVE